MGFFGIGKGNGYEEMNHDRLVNGAKWDHGLLYYVRRATYSYSLLNPIT
jgi:hypothetical protein